MNLSRRVDDVVFAEAISPADRLHLGVRAASPDGSVVLGTLTNERMQQVSFLLRLPVSAYGN